MQSVVNLHFRYTEAEFVAAARLYMLRTSATVLRLGLVCVLVGLTGLLLSFAMGAQTYVWLGPLLGLLMLLYVFLNAAPRQSFNRDPRLKDDFYWQFSEAAIMQKTSHSEATLKWDLFTRVIANERFYLLAYGKHMFAPIPRHAFATPAQEAAFVGLLRRKITPDFDTKFLPADTLRALDGYTPPPAPPDWR